MALITPGFPFPQYTVKDESEKNDAEDLAAALVAASLQDALARKIPADVFCKRANLDYPAVKAVLDPLIEKTDITLLGKPISPVKRGELEKSLTSLFSSRPDGDRVVAAALRKLHGYVLIDALFDDPDLEEVIINGLKEPVYVFHRKSGMCQTNVQFRNEKDLWALIDQFGRPEKGYALDANLADGSRANAILPPVVPQPYITIRKFRFQPWTVIDLMRVGTLTAEAAAFIWVAVDGLRIFPLNILVAGGTASGKTSLLNAMSAFIPPEERVLTIEEVLELNLAGRQDWVAMGTSKDADLDYLLRNALRMRPDRIIVGEVRGEEAPTMFTAMNTGHRGSMGTLHANSDRDVILRLESQPMNVPRSMIPLIDLVIMQHRILDREKGYIRRCTQISEISRMEDNISLNQIFQYDAPSDTLKRTDLPATSLEKIAAAMGEPIPKVMEEIKARQRLLEQLDAKDVHTFEEVTGFMHEFYAQQAVKNE